MSPVRKRDMCTLPCFCGMSCCFLPFCCFLVLPWFHAGWRLPAGPVEVCRVESESFRLQCIVGLFLWPFSISWIWLLFFDLFLVLCGHVSCILHRPPFSINEFFFHIHDFHTLCGSSLEHVSHV